TGLACSHHLCIPSPVPGAKTFGNDDVERPSQCLFARKAEDARRAVIPDSNGAVAIGVDHRVGYLLDQRGADMRMPYLVRRSSFLLHRSHPAVASRGLLQAFNDIR